jgi:exosome complex component RRP46
VLNIPGNAYVNTKTTQAQSVRLTQLQPYQIRNLCSFANHITILQNLAIIPILLHTSILGLLSAAIPLRDTITSVTIAVSRDAEKGCNYVINPTPLEFASATSIHTLAFTSSQHELILTESAGKFTMAEWEEVVAEARRACGQGRAMNSMELNDEHVNMHDFIRSINEAKIASDLQWKQ